MVNSAEVFGLYGGLHVPMRVLDSLSTSSKWRLTQFLDMFSLPEATLYADVSQVGVAKPSLGWKMRGFLYL